MTTIERVREEKMNEGAIIFCVPVSDETAASIETESTTIRIGSPGFAQRVALAQQNVTLPNGSGEGPRGHRKGEGNEVMR